MTIRPTREQEKRKRRRELIVAFGSALLMGVIILVEYRVARSSESVPLAGHLLLFVLLSVVTLLLILVIFFLIRNLFKLVFERRQRLLGANLKTRLTIAFVALTLVPTIVLFIASAGVVHTTIESWFKAQVEESLQSSLVIAQAYYQRASENLLNTGSRVASEIAERSLLDPDRSDQLAQSLESRRAAEGLSSIQIRFPDGRQPVIAKDPQLGSVDVPAPRSSFLKIALKGKTTSKILPLDGGSDLVRAIVPLHSADGGQVNAVLVLDHYIPTSLAGRLFEISDAFGDYQEAKRMKGPVKTIYVLILLMVALLVLLIGFWFGMSLAREITDPIQQLAEGTAKIATGELDVYIEPMGQDELGALVRSFNKMTGDLRKSRDELVKVNLDLDNRRKYMETVLKNVAAGVLSVDPDGRIATVNDSAGRLLRIQQKDILGKRIVDVLPAISANAVNAVMEELKSSGKETLERQTTLPFPEGSLSLICFAGSLRDEESLNLGFVLVFEDMTYLVKAQRMAAWRDVARRIAHEIKNPLTPIQLNAQRIRRKYMDAIKGDNEILDQCTSAIVDQVEQLKDMVNEFSKFARLPTANPVPDDLNEVVREVVDLYVQASEGIEFTFRPDPSVPLFDLDKEQMKRALVNLLDNASAAVAHNGKVHVATAYDPDLSMVSIEVADNGHGVNPVDRERLFEPYFSTKSGGTGLGLSIVSAIVSDHGGFIRVRDNPGGGARFVVELPLRRQFKVPFQRPS